MQIAFPQPRDKEANAVNRGGRRGNGIFVHCGEGVLHCEYVIVSALRVPTASNVLSHAG